MRNSELIKLVNANIITQEQADKIKVFSENSWWFQKSLITIWGFLIGLWVLSFVALNRDSMTNIVKILLLWWSTTAAYLWWRKLKESQKNQLGSVLLFIAWLLLWWTIFLIAQIYHLSVWNDILLWIRALLILPLVYLLKQKEYYYLFLILLSAFIITYITSHDFINPDYRNVIVMYIIFWFTLLLVGFIHEKYYEDQLLARLYKIFGADIAIIAYFLFIITSDFDSDPFIGKLDTLYILPTILLITFVGLILWYIVRYHHKKQKSIIYILWLLFIILLALYFNHPLLHYIFFIVWSLTMMFLWTQAKNIFLENAAKVYLYIFLMYLYGKYGRWYGSKTLFFIVGWILMITLWVWFKKIGKYMPNILSKLQHES